MRKKAARFPVYRTNFVPSYIRKSSLLGVSDLCYVCHWAHTRSLVLGNTSLYVVTDLYIP